MSTKHSMDLQMALQRLGAWQNDASDKQRRFKRFEVRGEARLWPGDPNVTSVSPITVHVRDISRGGVGLLASEPITRGHFWQMQLVDGGSIIATLPAFCRFCLKVVDGAYLIGVEFGVDTSIMIALGVHSKALAEGDEAENQRPLSGKCVTPEALLHEST